MMTDRERKLRYKRRQKVLGKLRVEVLLPATMVRRLEARAKQAGRSRAAELVELIERALIDRSRERQT